MTTTSTPRSRRLTGYPQRPVENPRQLWTARPKTGLTPRNLTQNKRNQPEICPGPRSPKRARWRVDCPPVAPAAAAAGYSGPAPDEHDPQPVGRVLAGYVEERGWQLPLAEARVFADWPVLVGTEVAMHCEPMTLRDGELRVTAESTAWATQLRLLTATIMNRLVAELGPEVVTKLVVTGPAGPSWKHGHYSVRGTRGPRDTYG